MRARGRAASGAPMAGEVPALRARDGQLELLYGRVSWCRATGSSRRDEKPAMNDRGVSLGDAPRGAMETPMAHQQKSRRQLSRRQILRSGAAALGGTGALLAGATSAAQNQGPAVLTGTQIG